MTFHTRTAKRGIVVVALIVSASTELLARVQAPGSKPSTCCNKRSPAR